MALPPWGARVAGAACPLDAPRPDVTAQWDLVAHLSVSSLYLTANQVYRGRCQLVFDPRHVARIDELSPDEWTALADDVYAAQRAIVLVVRPDHVNVESLGNVVPHLHWHIIPRYTGDPRWGEPVWQPAGEAEPFVRLHDSDRAALLIALRDVLIARFSSARLARPGALAGANRVCPAAVQTPAAAACRAARPSRCRRTSGHSVARMLYITVSRALPSRRGAWCRSTPSFCAPRASIARCERRLKRSVRSPTTSQCRVSNACASSRRLQAVLRCVRWNRWAYPHVADLHAAHGGDDVVNRVVPATAPLCRSRTTHAS